MCSNADRAIVKTRSSEQEGLTLLRKSYGLSEWSAWSSWADQGACGARDAKGYYQKRTRTRTCDDSKKSCMSENLSETDTRFKKVCSQIDIMFIYLPDYYHAGTTADLRLGIRQGSIFCKTKDPTWDAPDDGPKYHIRRGNQGCYNTFDKTKSVDLWLYSDSNNDVYISNMGVRIGGIWKDWYSPGEYTAIDHDTNNGWHTTIDLGYRI